MSITTYPLDGKYYNAQDAETYLCTRTSGVFSEDISFTPNGMNITVSPFLAWIKNDDFSGKSVAVTTDTTLTISPSEPILSRIDRIVLRFDARKNESELTVLKGTPSSSPAAPSIERTPVIYDLCLCQISVKPSATSISAGNITSTLLDESLCGIMRDGVTGIPTLQLQSQAQALLRELEVAISMAENGSPVLQSLGIKRGTVDVTIGTEGQKTYTSDAVPFDVAFLDTPTIVVSRRTHSLNEYVCKQIKPQESVSVNASHFTLNVFSETDIPATQTLRYNWIAIGRVEWENGDTGGGEEEPEIEYFNIRTTVSPEGTGTTTGAGNYAKGSTVTLNATPASGYAFEGWYIGSSKITSNASYNITVTSDTIYTAKFVEEVPMITVTVTTDPVGAGSVSGAGTYPKGSTVKLTASPGDRYRFIGWYSGDSKVSPNTEYSVTLNASMAYVAKFEEEVVTPDYYTIITKVSPTGAGSTTGGGQYAAGTSVKLTATANEGYLFSHWSRGTETRATAEITVAATADQTWTANFIEGEEDTEEKVTITINVEPEGAGTVAGNGEVNSGAMSAIQATANSGYRFKHWRFEDGTTNEANPYLFKASTDRTFVAVFEVDSGEEETTYTEDTLVDGVLYVGTQTTNIEGNDYFYDSRSDITTVIIPEGRTKIGAGAFYGCRNLAQLYIPSTLTLIDGQAFHANDSLTTINYNGTKAQWKNISIQMDNDFDNVTVNCTDGSLSYIKVIPVASPYEGGSAEASYLNESNSLYILKTIEGYQHAQKAYLFVYDTATDNDIKLTATANEGYQFKHWLFENGTTNSHNPLSPIIFEKDEIIKAVFEQETTTEKKTITILGSIGTTKVVCNGVELSNSRSNFTHEFNIGDEVTLTFTPDSGNAFASWLNDDTLKALSYDNPWTFTVDSSMATNIGITISET